MTGGATPESVMSWAQVRARRLDRQALSTPASDMRPADVVAAMCGAHAQVLSAAELSVALRIADATRTHVRDALWAEHSLIKTFGPTRHRAPAARGGPADVDRRIVGGAWPGLVEQWAPSHPDDA